MDDLKELKDLIKSGDCVFLVGNGINLATDNSKSWNRLLRDLAERYSHSSGYLKKILKQKNTGISYPEIAEIIEEEHSIYKQKAKKGMSNSKRSITSLVKLQGLIYDFSRQKLKDSLFLDFLKRNAAIVLTTNFDENIEESIWGNDNYDIVPWGDNSCCRKEMNYYSWNKISVQQNDKNSSRIWHIHGRLKRQKDKTARQLLLSLSDYVNASNNANRLLEDESFLSHHFFWLNLFMNKPLIIMGLSLDPQEIFLRWLLLRRKNIIERRKKNKCSSFYLERISPQKDYKNNGKEFFLNSVGFKIEYLKDPYNADIWPKTEKGINKKRARDEISNISKVQGIEKDDTEAMK